MAAAGAVLLNQRGVPGILRYLSPPVCVQGCILLASNPGVISCIAGLIGASSYQSGADRHFLWQRRNETVPEYNMTVHQVRDVAVHQFERSKFKACNPRNIWRHLSWCPVPWGVKPPQGGPFTG
jgi:hypothetical protein